MDILDDSIKTTLLENFEPGYQKSEPGTILSDTLLLLNNIEYLYKSDQVGQGLEQLPENTNCDGDNLVAKSKDLNSGERPEMEDTVELLCEQVETLKELLHYKQLELQEIERELRYTNEDLCAALNSELVTLDEAKQLVKKILITKKPVGETLAKLLSAIYNSPVKACELEQTDKSNSTTPSTSVPDNDLLINFEAFKTKITALRKQSAEIRAKSRIVRDYTREVKTECRHVKAQLSQRPRSEDTLA